MGAKIITKSDRDVAAKFGTTHALTRHETPVEEQRAMAVLGDATRMLAEVRDAPSAKNLMDMASAAELYARKAKLGEEAIRYASGIKLDAERRLGEYLKPQPKASGLGVADEFREIGNSTRMELYEELGISSQLASEAIRLTALPDEEFAKVKSGEMKPSVAFRNQKRAELPAKIAALPAGKFRLIYADPPWKYGDEREGLEKEGTAAAAQYPTMPTAAICEFADEDGRHVSDLGASDSVLFMWATFPLLVDGLAVMKAWKYDYKTAFVWDKQRSNIGNYHDASCELLMIGVRGSCPIEIDTRIKQVQSIARAEHSRKPERWRGIIESLYPSSIVDGPNLRAVELFRRGAAPRGWVVWGNESEVAA